MAGEIGPIRREPLVPPVKPVEKEPVINPDTQEPGEIPEHQVPTPNPAVIGPDIPALDPGDPGTYKPADPSRRRVTQTPASRPNPPKTGK